MNWDRTRPNSRSGRRNQLAGGYRRLLVERLEDRRVLAVGDLLTALDNGAPAASDSFGLSVGISGVTVVVGSPGRDAGASDAGAAYVFSAATGNLRRTLNNPTPVASDLFGSSVAVSGNLVVVGALQDDTGATDAGAAYVFDAITGGLLRTLNNPTPAASDYFGVSVAVFGNMVVVGATGDNTGAADAGCVYVFDALTGILLRTLNNPAPAASDAFGSSVAIWGTTIVVGALQDDASASEAGSAYVFNALTGSLLHTLNNPAPTVSDYFGVSVAISGSAIVVGATGDDAGAADAGSAYVFDALTGELVHSLHNPAAAVSDYFGFSVAVLGSMIAIGAVGDDAVATDAGSAYVFDAISGDFLQPLSNPAPAESDVFGTVAISPLGIVVGAALQDATKLDRGAVYLFDTGSVATNQAPSFLKGADQNVFDDSGPQTIAGWATEISPGSPDEADQTPLTFLITNVSNPDIFSGPLSIDAAGQLQFTPRPNTEGTADVTVQLQDSGGTLHGGSNTSPPQTFTIAVTKPHRWHNGLPPYAPLNRGGMEVDTDGEITSTDALLIINYLNAALPADIPATALIANGTTRPFYDVDGDDSVTSTDALLIINMLNANQGGPIGGEGEASSAGLPSARDGLFRELDLQAAGEQMGVSRPIADLIAALNAEEMGLLKPRRRP